MKVRVEWQATRGGCCPFFVMAPGCGNTVPAGPLCIPSRAPLMHGPLPPLDARYAAEGRPHVAFRVYDWDLVSADDFLGQCEVPFDSLDASMGGPSPPRWIPLYGYMRGTRKVEAGEIQVAAWFEAGGGQGQQGELTSFVGVYTLVGLLLVMTWNAQTRLPAAFRMCRMPLTLPFCLFC